MVRWLVESGPEITPAEKYIEQLEREVASLREQVCVLAWGRWGAVRVCLWGDWHEE